MHKKIDSVVLASLFVFLAVSAVIAQDSIGPYNRAADVNGDGVVDILDLAAVGQAFGSHYTPRTQANTTIITVLDLNRNPSEVESARVAIFQPVQYGVWFATAIGFTNSSGIATFTLSPNVAYTAIAWTDNSHAYNWANFTTNRSGEASMVILLGMPALPPNCIVYTFLENGTDHLYTQSIYLSIWLAKNPMYSPYISQSPGWHSTWEGYIMDFGNGAYGGTPILILNGDPLTWPPDQYPSMIEPNSFWAATITAWPMAHDVGFVTFVVDENGSANVIIYITPP